MANPGVHPITSADAGRVSAFLHQNLNSRVSSEAWQKLLVPSWEDTGPNHGFQLTSDDGAVVGAYVAVYSQREVDGITIDDDEFGADLFETVGSLTDFVDGKRARG